MPKNIHKNIPALVVVGFSILLALGLGTSLFLYVKLQQRIDDAVAETLLSDQTRVRVRDAQVAYMQMSQQVADILLQSPLKTAFDEQNLHEQMDHAIEDIGIAFAATQNTELKMALQQLINYSREVITPVREEIVQLATTDPAAAEKRYLQKYLPAQAKNMVLLNDAIRLSSNELKSFNEKANEIAASAQFVSRIAIILFACFGIGVAVFLGRVIARVESELRLKATHDALTGLYNRGAILDILRKAMVRRERNAFPLSVIFADLDNFKRTNDDYGHQAGDVVLREVARRVTEMLRPYDSFGRYGGEELLIVLPECDANNALAIAERVRSVISAQPIMTNGSAIFTTVSLGVATVDGKSSLYFDELIQLADNALYQAKEKGRNRVVFANANLR